MGQQQLLLVILVVIVVGIATILATHVISVGATEANRDAVRQDLFAAAASVQEVWERPTIMEGAARNFTVEFNDQILARSINLPGKQTDNVITNKNATYTVSISDEVTVVVEAVPKSGGNNMTITIQRYEQIGWIFELNDGINSITNQPDD